MSNANINKEARIVICGAGCFGLSTALQLRKQGYTNIVLLEMSSVYPNPDAASTDMNKMVRKAYEDYFYVGFADSAITLWKEDMWKGCYHETKVYILEPDIANRERPHPAPGYSPYTISPKAKRITAEEAAQVLPFTAESFKGPIWEEPAYEGGWVESGRAIATLAEYLTKQPGVELRTGHEVIGLAHGERGEVVGVRVRDKPDVPADFVITTCGAWTVQTFPQWGLQTRMVPTGQPVVTIDLTDEEAKKYADLKPVLDFDTGFYIFPVTGNKIKTARHCLGAINPKEVQPDPSKPAIKIPSAVEFRRRLDSQGQPTAEESIPRSEAELIRRALRERFVGTNEADLGERPFSSSRMCWYNDAIYDDWVVDFHPEFKNVVIAAGDSGHAFKFLPNFGQLVVQRLEGKMLPEYAFKFQLDRKDRQVPGSLWEGRLKITLDNGDLVFGKDLDPKQELPTLEQDTLWINTRRDLAG